MAEELLRLLSSSKNQSILGLLTIEPSYPRRLAEILELSEADVARRLRRMMKAGIVTSEWSQVGQNVKLYRLVTDTFKVSVGATGLQVSTDGKGTAAPVARVDPVPEELPKNAFFVGRRDELSALQDSTANHVVLGLPGIGKTSLLAELAARWSEAGRVFWCGFRGVESFNWLAHRFALFFARHDDTRLLRAIERDAENAEKWSLILDGMDQSDHLFIFDDVHRVRDDLVSRFFEEAAERVQVAKVVFASREPIGVRPSVERVHTLRLEGLTDEDVKQFLSTKGLTVVEEEVALLRDRLGGHPLALNLLVGAAQVKEETVGSLLDRVPEGALEDFLLSEVNDTLKEDERRVMSLASLFRTQFTREDLQSLTDRPVDGPVLRLRRRMLLDSRSEGFYLHETLRNFFYEHLADRKRLHQKVAHRYLAAGTEEGRLEAMHHLLAAGRRDEVLEMMETNLDLREFEKLDARYHDVYFSVLDRFHRDDVMSDRRWALMEDERGDILFHRGDLEEALEHYDEALEYFNGSEEDRARVADLHWKRALALARLGRTKEAEAARREGLKEAPERGLARRRLEEFELDG